MKKQTQKRILISTAILLILYTGLGFFLVPWIMKSQMLKHLPEFLDREVTVEKVKFNPFTLTTRLEQLRVTDLDGEPMVAFASLTVNFQSISLFQKGFTFKQIHLQEPYGRIKRDAVGVLNFADLISPKENDTDETALPIIRIEQFLLERGTFVAEDEMLESPYRKEVREITFGIDNLTTEPDKSGGFVFTAASEEAEAFSWTGELTLNPLSVRGQILIESLELPRFRPYKEPFLGGRIEEGLLSIQLDYLAGLSEEGLVLQVGNGSLSLNGFSFKTVDTEEALVAWERFSVQGFEGDLQAGRVDVASVMMDGMSVVAHRDEEGGLNFLKAYIPPGERDDLTSGDSGLDPEWGFLVNSINVSDTSIRLIDESLTVPADVKVSLPLVQVLWFSNESERPYEFTLLASDGQEGDLRLTGKGTTSPLAGQYQVELAGWDLSPLNPFLQEFLNLEIVSGLLSMDSRMEVRFNEGVADTATFSGGISLRDFQSRETREKESFVSWQDFSLRGIEVDLLAGQLAIDSIDYLNPVIQVKILEDGSNSFLSLLPPEDIGEGDEGADSGEPVEELAEGGSAEDSPGVRMEIGTFAIANGQIVFTDLQQSPAVNLTMDKIDGSIKGLSSDKSTRPSINMEMNIMGMAPLTIEGNLNLLTDEPFADLAILLRGLEMTPFAPYFSRYVGYHLDRGLLNLDLKYQVEERLLQSENVVLINQLTLGQRSGSPDATTLPVALAISLLKDSAGDIKVDLPIQGNLDDPEFRIGRVITRVISNLIVRLASSPFNLLASLANTSAEDLQRVTFSPGRHVLTEAAQANLEALATAMRERPGIRLEISASIDPSVETSAVRRMKLAEKLRPEFGREEDVTLQEAESYQALVERAYRSQLAFADRLKELPPFREKEEFFLETITVDNSDLNQLAIQRKQAVRNYLVRLDGIEPERVLVIASETLETVDSGTSQADLSIR